MNATIVDVQDFMRGDWDITSCNPREKILQSKLQKTALKIRSIDHVTLRHSMKPDSKPDMDR